MSRIKDEIYCVHHYQHRWIKCEISYTITQPYPEIGFMQPFGASAALYHYGIQFRSSNAQVSIVTDVPIVYDTKLKIVQSSSHDTFRGFLNAISIRTIS